MSVGNVRSPSDVVRSATAPTAIDLFAGAGGATQGMRDAGFTVLAAVEKDPDAAATYAANHGTVKLLRRNISYVSARALRATLQLSEGELTLLKACPPCQGFSTLGAADTADPRNDLIQQITRFAVAFKPATILMENVPGLRNDRRFAGLLQRIASVGYTVRTYVVDAENFGVPQRRRRAILFAVRSDISFELPDELTGLLPAEVPLERRTAEDVFSQRISPDDPMHVWRRNSSTTRRRIEAIPIGGSRFNLPADLELRCHR